MESHGKTLKKDCCLAGVFSDSVDVPANNHHRLLQISSAHTHTHPFNGPFSGTTQVSRYQKGGTNLNFTEARDSEWQ